MCKEDMERPPVKRKFVIEFTDDTYCNYIDYIPDMDAFKRRLATEALKSFPITYGNIDDAVKVTFVKEDDNDSQN